MASNGYVRCDCSGCLFYSSDREYGDSCNLKSEELGTNGMIWISANDCERSPFMEEKYYEKCEHRTSVQEVKNLAREKLGIERLDYERRNKYEKQ